MGSSFNEGDRDTRAATVVAASDSLRQASADYVCNGTADEVEINAALGTGARKVVLRAGNYNVNRSDDTGYFAIGVPSNTELELLKGAIITLANGQNCGVISNKNPTLTTDTNIVIRGGKIDGNKANQSDYLAFADPLADKTGHGIQLRGCSNSRISGVEIVDTYQHSIMVWNSACNNIIDHCRISDPGTAGSAYQTVSAICVYWNSHNNIVSDNILTHSAAHGSQQAGCRGIYPSNPIERCIVKANIVDGFRTGINFMVNDASHENAIINNHIGDAMYGITTESAGTKGRGMIIDGNNIYADDYGMHIRYLKESTISNNLIRKDSNYMVGIQFRECEHILITGNYIRACTLTPSDSINFDNIDHLIMTGNRANSPLIIDADCSNVNIQCNRLNGITTAVGGIYRNNDGYVTENSGTDTLAAGATSKDVTHGLDVTPAAGDVMITPMTSLLAATEFWIDGYNSTKFTINVDGAPGGAGIPFAWKAIVL